MVKLRLWTWAFTKWYFYVIPIILFWINYNNQGEIPREYFLVLFIALFFGTYFWMTLGRLIYVTGHKKAVTNL